MTQPPFSHQGEQDQPQPPVSSMPYMAPVNSYPPPSYNSPHYPAPTYSSYSQAPYQHFSPSYPQIPYQHTPYNGYPYNPHGLYPQPAYPYPHTILPPVKVPEPDRENEIYFRGYKEDADYPHDQTRKERRIARFVLFCVIALLITFFFTPLTELIFPKNISTFSAMLATFGFEIILIFVFSLILRRAFPQGMTDTFGLKKPRGSYVLIGIGSAFGALTLAFVGAVIVMLLGGDFTKNPQIDRYADLPSWQFFIVMLIFVPLIAPLLEELLFRGILVGSAVRAFPGKLGFFVAIIVTGLLFGSLHFPGTFDIIGAYVVILISTIGMFFAWLRLKSNSTLVTMATHATYNGIIAFLQLVGSMLGAATLPVLS